MGSNEQRWEQNYATTQALDLRYKAWAESSKVEGPFGVDLAPALPMGARFLDAGCGTGVHLRTLIDRYPEARYSAIDASSAMVETTRRVCPEAEVREGDIEDLPWEDNSFAGACACMSSTMCRTSTPLSVSWRE
jgi:SAM-dependent methyltransferase